MFGIGKCISSANLGTIIPKITILYTCTNISYIYLNAYIDYRNTYDFILGKSNLP